MSKTCPNDVYIVSNKDDTRLLHFLYLNYSHTYRKYFKYDVKYIYTDKVLFYMNILENRRISMMS